MRDVVVTRATEKVDRDEVLRLAAVDDEFFGRTFFPKTVRQVSPSFHRDIDVALSALQNRFTAIEVFRGGAKTSKLRLFTAKRIAYAISHTILFVSNSQAHSVKSVEWLKKAVEFNTGFAKMFQLRKGGKWTAEDIEIIHGIDEYPIRVMALGITGQIRGINIDDYRPDLIVCDDPDNEETTATPEQRKKTSDLFFGALAKSLAPASESPFAKMVLLQTPLNPFDLVETCRKDAQWTNLRFGCFDEAGQSRWPTRFSTETLLADKAAHIQRNQLALWMREMECTIVAEETASFKQGWLRWWDVLPDGMRYTIAIDPAASDSSTADFFAIVVLGFYKADVYVVDVFAARGVMPDAAANAVFDFILKYRPLRVVCETVAYQKVLAWYLKREMETRRIFVSVQPFTDRRRKSDRILQSLLGVASSGHLHCHRTHTSFVQQFVEYSPNFRGHDDIIDAVSIGVSANSRTSDAYEGEYSIVDDEKDIPALDTWRSAP